MEDWKIIFLSQNGWVDVICRFQPLISQGVAPVRDPTTQAVLMADHIFSRCGAVPGILDAIIVQGDASEASESLSKAKVRSNVAPVGPGLGHRLVGKWGR